MTQPINISINVSPVHLFVAVVFSSMLMGAGDTVRLKIVDAVNTVYAGSKNLLLDSPVIALATGLTYGVQQLTSSRPSLQLSSEGAMNAATFVGEVLALKSALTPFLRQVTKKEDRKTEITHATMIRNTVVLHCLPVALGALYAYYNSIPVKLTQSTLYLSALIPTIKLLGKGFEAFCEMEGVKERIQDWYSWMNLEKLGESGIW